MKINNPTNQISPTELKKQGKIHKVKLCLLPAVVLRESWKSTISTPQRKTGKEIGTI